MPDFAEVSDTLAGIVAGLLYPNGTGQPSVTGDVYTIFPGWPTQKCLKESINDGRVQVTVYPLRGEKNVTRYPQDPGVYSRGEKTITATIDEASDTITLGGSVSTPQTVAISCNGKTVSYGVQQSDTLTSIATALAALVSAQITAASSSGQVVSVPGAIGLACNVGVAGQLVSELKRQQKQFMISIWAPDHVKRSRAGKAIDGGLARLKWLSFPDYTGGLNIYVRGDDSDGAEEMLLYRRDIVYQVEFPTIDVIDGASEVVVAEQNITASPLPDGTVERQINTTE